MCQSSKTSVKRFNGSNSGGISVVLIGCGPGGMSLLHALKLRQHRLDPDSAEFHSLPSITCYERGPAPGGLWRDPPADDKGRERPENKKLQYEDLWLNNPKELIEYFDYTFDDHFKKPTPSFLPRREVWEYLVARHSRSGSLNDVHYNHTVTSVSYNSSNGKFVVTIRNNLTSDIAVQEYDRCVWACGENGDAKKPLELLKTLQSFNGKYFHSVEATDSFEEDVRDKIVLMIGSSNSAEDLSLRAIKLGAEHIYICTRSGQGDATAMGSWPRDKVTIVYGVPQTVENGNSFVCTYKKTGEQTRIDDVDTVILCTGYETNQRMLDGDLNFDESGKWSVSKGWCMKENLLTPFIGEVAPGKELFGFEAVPFPSLYQGMLISNPRMMFLHEFGDSPLFEIEVSAWLLIAYMTGDVKVPSKEEMVNSNQEMNEAEMQLILGRVEMDGEYSDHVDTVYDMDEGEWLDDDNDERTRSLTNEIYDFNTRALAGRMKLANYPVDFGDGTNLSELGKRYADLARISESIRKNVSQDDDPTGQTFRDAFLPEYVSLFTGTPSVPLPSHWLNLEAKEGESTKLSTFETMREV